MFRSCGPSTQTSSGTSRRGRHRRHKRNLQKLLGYRRKRPNSPPMRPQIGLEVKAVAGLRGDERSDQQRDHQRRGGDKKAHGNSSQAGRHSQPHPSPGPTKFGTGVCSPRDAATPPLSSARAAHRALGTEYFDVASLTIAVSGATAGYGVVRATLSQIPTTLADMNRISDRAAGRIEKRRMAMSLAGGGRVDRRKRHGGTMPAARYQTISAPGDCVTSVGVSLCTAMGASTCCRLFSVSSRQSPRLTADSDPLRHRNEHVSHPSLRLNDPRRAGRVQAEGRGL
jgi:hypothetical protein